MEHEVANRFQANHGNALVYDTMLYHMEGRSPRVNQSL